MISWLVKGTYITSHVGETLRFKPNLYLKPYKWGNMYILEMTAGRRWEKNYRGLFWPYVGLCFLEIINFANFWPWPQPGLTSPQDTLAIHCVMPMVAGRVQTKPVTIWHSGSKASTMLSSSWLDMWVGEGPIKLQPSWWEMMAWLIDGKRKGKDERQEAQPWLGHEWSWPPARGSDHQQSLAGNTSLEGSNDKLPGCSGI